MKLTVTGPDLEYQISQIVNDVHKEAQQRLLHMGEDILDLSYTRVPVWTGTLESSGFVEEQESGEVVVGYASEESHDRQNPETGKMASEYAWEVHEEGTSSRPDSPQKYLTSAANDILKNYQRYFDDLPIDFTDSSGMKVDLEGGD